MTIIATCQDQRGGDRGGGKTAYWARRQATTHSSGLADSQILVPINSKTEVSQAIMAEDLTLYLYVDSVLRTGIVSDNLTSAKSNSELVRSLESLLEHSLACPRHTSRPLPSTSCSSPSTLFEGVPSLTQPSKADVECEAVPSWSYIPPPTGSGQASARSTPAYVTIPAQDTIRQEPAVAFPETREALDVTAKFFYLPPSDYSPSSNGTSSSGTGTSSSATSLYDSLDPAWINESLEQLRIATGLTEVDTFIISFPGLTFDNSLNGEDCCDDENARTNGTSSSSSIIQNEDKVRENIIKVWKEASKNKHLLSLGVSEFSLDRLHWLLDQAKSEEGKNGTNADGNDTGSSTGRAGTTGITSTRFRKPRVCQVNTRNRCDVPSELVQFAKEENVDLLVHADCSDFLPPRTFTRLLARYGARLPPPLTHKGPLDISTLSSKGQHKKSASSSAASSSSSPPSSSHINLKLATASSSLHARMNGSTNTTTSTTSTDASKGEEEEEAREVLKALSARWVLKYTVLIRDRALVADKGYIVKASRNLA